MSALSDKDFTDDISGPKDNGRMSKSSEFVGLVIIICLFVIVLASTYLTFAKPEHEGRRIIYYIGYGIIFITNLLPILIYKFWKTNIGKIFFSTAFICGVLFLGGWSIWYIQSLMSTAPSWVFGLILIYFIFKK